MSIPCTLSIGKREQSDNGKTLFIARQHNIHLKCVCIVYIHGRKSLEPEQGSVLTPSSVRSQLFGTSPCFDRGKFFFSLWGLVIPGYLVLVRDYRDYNIVHKKGESGLKAGDVRRG